ncbi:hypothetical protein QAD02_006937 [Eretmocerus hayati]|uniref:Uncharacterized protein n=1 Tax=Eretmocerus hayati TaxID=131215 RepID=A0ACC2N278_9HYME|nr:hypothetical protein QAD02_006937 [Eretmocerus hayati]
MKRLLFLIFLPTRFYSGSPREVNQTVGRLDVSENAPHYQANLIIVNPEDDLEEACMGSIIHKRWILTAAHCLYHLTNPKYLIIIVGTANFSGTGGTYYEYEMHKSHEKWNKTPVNDIALIRLKKDILFTEKINFVKLSRTDNYKKNDIIASLSSWGSSENLPPLPRLSSKRFAVISEIKCHRQLSSLIEKRKNHPADIQFFKTALDKISLLVCTNRVKRGGNLCHGDSGAPLIFNDTLIGIVSSSYECSNRPGLSTRISKYIDWIEQQMSSFSEKLP